jgi:RimJ/RimL family protein N-acetyltransferase
MEPEVQLREVRDDDLDVFFGHQREPAGVTMAAVPSRGRDEFMAHWAKIRADDATILRTIVVDGAVAGNIVSWRSDVVRLVGYWVGGEHWGRGVATQALALFLGEVSARPLEAHVALHNLGSMRVLEKCGFRRDREREAAPPPHDGIEEAIFVLAA